MVSITDVARHAGVSISTVSYAMSGKRSLKEETKQLVLRTAKELGYIPNANARKLRGKPTQVLALSSPVHGYTDYSNYAMFFFALATRARRYGYDILLLMHEYGDQELTRIAESGVVDGILLLDVLIDDSRAEVAKTLNLPVVAVGYPNNSDGIYSVDLNFEKLGREAVERAYALGHRHVLIVGSYEYAYADGSNYLIRFRDAAIKRGDDLGLSVLFKPSTGFSRADVDLLLDEAFVEDQDITAIICQTNATQMDNILISLHQRGKSIPQDISVLSTCTPEVGQIARKIDEMPLNPTSVCSRAIDLMMEVLDGKRADVGHIELIRGEYIANGTMVACR